LTRAMSKKKKEERGWNGERILSTDKRVASLTHGDSQEVERGSSRSGSAGEARKGRGIL
jgi:hypothetical protein